MQWWLNVRKGKVTTTKDNSGVRWPTVALRLMDVKEVNGGALAHSELSRLMFVCGKLWVVWWIIWVMNNVGVIMVEEDGGLSFIDDCEGEMGHKLEVLISKI
ncbi:hypothetical protein RJT34_13178 [Clitoria ternatea]|uniref:Uncharacterized protein n=1 Tax=Clitoria ternatea TaxID=43366 RepID=A0AAN9JNG6_CLITE